MTLFLIHAEILIIESKEKIKSAKTRCDFSSKVQYGNIMKLVIYCCLFNCTLIFITSIETYLFKHQLCTVQPVEWVNECLMLSELVRWPRVPFSGFLVLWSEKALATHSSTLAWQIPWTEEPGGLQFMGSLRVGCDWATSLSLLTFMHWRRKWQPTPVFLPGQSQGRGSLAGCRLWGRTESDATDVT